MTEIQSPQPDDEMRADFERNIASHLSPLHLMSLERDANTGRYLSPEVFAAWWGYCNAAATIASIPAPEGGDHIAAMRQALEALEVIAAQDRSEGFESGRKTVEAIAALRAALAAQQQAGPETAVSVAKSLSGKESTVGLTGAIEAQQAASCPPPAEGDGRAAFEAAVKVAPRWEGCVGWGFERLTTGAYSNAVLDAMWSGWQLRAAHVQPKGTAPVAWTLRETLDKAETTTTGYLWFTDPKNSAWAPLYAEPQQQAWVWNPAGLAWEAVRTPWHRHSGALYAYGTTPPDPLATPAPAPGEGSLLAGAFADGLATAGRMPLPHAYLCNPHDNGTELARAYDAGVKFSATPSPAVEEQAAPAGMAADERAFQMVCTALDSILSEPDRALLQRPERHRYAREAMAALTAPPVLAAASHPPVQGSEP